MSSFLTIHRNGRVACDDDAEKFHVITKNKPTHEWEIQKNGKEFKISVYGKITGKFNTVNKYEFPPPVDNILFYGKVFIIGYRKRESSLYELEDMSVDVWKIFSQHTFQLENLRESEFSDEREIDELRLVPLHLKTKHGYLKDGFVVDDDDF